MHLQAERKSKQFDPANFRPHELRVVDELDALSDKLDKLTEFINSNSIFQSLPDSEKDRLKLQRYLMDQYEDVLVDRIENFPAGK